MITVIVNATVLSGGREWAAKAVIFEADRIVDLVPNNELPTSITKLIDARGKTLAPGFIDLQVNGGGVLFNNDPSVEAIVRIGEAHARFGATGFLPTLISDNTEIMQAAIEAVRVGLKTGVPGLLGIHLEGPFPNVGKRGCHQAANIRPIGETDLDLVSSLDSGVTLMTVAPEQIPSPMLRELSARGVILAAGHSLASFAETQAALANGVSGFTHLHNAMNPMLNRAPGIIGAALLDDGAWVSLIADGYHVHPAVLEATIRAKPQQKVILVTDAMSAVGSSQNAFELNGETIRVIDGRCLCADGTIAGSNLSMDQAVRNIENLTSKTMAQALQMASENPAKAIGLGLRCGIIAPGFQADFVLLDDAYRVDQTWIAGENVYQREVDALHFENQNNHV